MNVIAILVGLGIIVAAVLVIATKMGKLSDRDGDSIPDVVEDAVEDVKETVEEVKEEIAEIKKKATRKKPGRKPKAKGGSTSTGGSKSHYKGTRKAKK